MRRRIRSKRVWSLNRPLRGGQSASRPAKLLFRSVILSISAPLPTRRAVSRDDVHHLIMRLLASVTELNQRSTRSTSQTCAWLAS